MPSSAPTPRLGPGLRPRVPTGPAALAVSAAAHLAAVAALAAWSAPGQEAAGAGGAMTVTLVAAEARPEAAPTAAAPQRPTPSTIVAAAAPPIALDPPPTQPPTLVAAARPRARPRDLAPTPDAAPVEALSARQAPEAISEAGRPRLEARGTGDGAAAGAGAAAVAAGAGAAGARAEAIWAAQVQRRLQSRLAAPAGAAGMRLTLALSVAPDGALRAAAIHRSSGVAAVDAAALRAVRRAGRLPAAPAGLTDPAYAFTAPIVWN